MTDKRINYTVSADDSQFGQAMARVQATLKQTNTHVEGLFSGLQAPFGKLMGMFAAATAALAGGKMFGEAIDANKEFTGEAIKLSKVLGTNATEASTLNVALGDIYSNADTFATAANKLARELRTNEDGLRRMGLQTRDAKGELRPMKDLMMESLSIINGYSEGIDRTIKTQQFFGKGAEEVTGLLKLNTQVLEEARKKQEELGLVVGAENVEALRSYKAAMNDTGDVFLAIKKVIGDALMPVLTRLGQWFADIGPAAVVVAKGAIGGFTAVFWGLKNAVQAAWEVLAGLVETLTVGLAATVTGVAKFLSGDLAGAFDSFRSGSEVIADVWQKRMDNIVDSSRDTQQRLLELFGNPTALPTKNKEGDTVGPDPDTKRSLMAQFEAQLNLLKQHQADKNAAEGTFYEFSKQRELDFWQAKAGIVMKGTKDAFAIQAKITEATLGIQKEAFEKRLAELRREQDATEQNFAAREALARQEQALVIQRYGTESKQAEEAARKISEIQRQAREQRKRLREAELAEISQASDAAIEIARQQAQLQLDLGMIDKSRLLQLEREFEDARFQIAAAAARERLAMVDPSLNPVEYARLKNEIAQIEQQHQVRMGQLNADTVREQARDWAGLFGSMESGFASVLEGFLNGSKSLAQTVRGLFQAIGNSIVSTLAQIAARWLVQQIAQRVMGKVTAASQVASNAAVAGSAAFASTAAIPIIGPELAPGAAAAAYGGAMSFLATIPAAARGYDIPAGINPLTQLHEREMVLPKEHADVIRELAGGRPGGSLEIQVKGERAGDFFILHHRELAKALNYAARNFAWSPKR